MRTGKRLQHSFTSIKVLSFITLPCLTCLVFAGITPTDGNAQTNSRPKALEVLTLADNIDAGTGGLAFDKDGNIYTADFGSQLGGGGQGGDKIFRITPDGNKVSLFHNGFAGASGNCFDKNGNLFQSNIRGNLIHRITPNGKPTEFSKTGLRNPVGIAIGDDGTLYVCNCGSSSIQKITKDGTSSVFVKSSLLKCPNGITFDDDQNLYVSNFYNGDVLKITKDAKISRLATLPGNNNGHITFHKGELFAVARSAHQIYRITLDGKASVFAGTGKRGKKNGSPSEATFSLPNDIGISPDGKSLLVNEVSPTDTSNLVLSPTRIRKILLRD